MIGQTSLMDLTIGLLVGNFAYLIFTLILSMILGVGPTDMFAGPFSGTANSLVSSWVVAGALLGVADVLAVVGFVSSVLGDGW